MRGLDETEKLAKDIIGIIVKMPCTCAVTEISVDKGKVVGYSADHCMRCKALDRIDLYVHMHTCNLKPEDVENRYLMYRNKKERVK